MKKPLDQYSHVDLHIHTTASDGTWSPAGIIAECKKKSISVISITDHDTVGFYDDPLFTEIKEFIYVIEGVEISAMFENSVIHILGYGIDINSKNFLELLNANKRAQIERDLNCIRNLTQDRPDINEHAYRDFSYDKSRGGWKLLNFLIDNEVCQNGYEYFQLIRKGKLYVYDNGYANINKVIETIHHAGGLAVAAHVGVNYKNTNAFEDHIKMLMEYGIDGVECYHSLHDAKTTSLALKSCSKYNLLITGGSDTHGNLPDRHMGRPKITIGRLKENNLVNRLLQP